MYIHLDFKNVFYIIHFRPHYQMTSVGRISKPPQKFQMVDVKSLLKNAKKKPKPSSSTSARPTDDGMNNNDTAEAVKR